MNKVLCSALIAAFTIAVPLAHADGVYAGASIAGANASHVEQSDGGTLTRYDAQREQTQLRVFSGYQLDARWGVEAGYRGFGGDTTFVFNDGGKLKVHTSAFYAAAKGDWKLSDDWSLFAKAGLARSRMELDISGTGGAVSGAASKTGAYLSAGASYLLATDVALQLELEHIGKLRYQGMEAGMSRLSLGLRYNF